MRGRLGCGILAAAAVGIVVIAVVAAIIESRNEAKEGREAEQHLVEVNRLLDEGRGADAMALLLQTAADHPDTDAIEDDSALSATLRRFPPADLATGSARSPNALEPMPAERFAALCDEAILTAYPQSLESAGARARLLALLGIGETSTYQGATSAFAAAIRGLAAVDDPAFVDSLAVTVEDGAEGYSEAAEVLGAMGERGVPALAVLLGAEEFFVRRAITYGLAKAPRDPTVGILDQAMQEGTDTVRKHAAEAFQAAIEVESPWAAEAEALLRAHLDDPMVAIGGVTFVISEGREETIPALVDGLFAAGTKDEAELLLNCGNDELAEAAREWAAANGYTIEQTPGSTGVKWGE